MCGIRTIQSDRLIKIYIADVSEPYLVQEAVLTNIWKWFAKAIKNRANLGTEAGVLRFPDDHQGAWEILLYWIIKGQFLCEGEDERSHIIQLVRCWVLGDKYCLADFQDLAMADLLQILNSNSEAFPFYAVELAFSNTPDKSPLRTLIARWVVHEVVTGVRTAEDMEMLDGVAGFLAEMVKAYKFKDKEGLKVMRYIFRQGDWEEFLVGGGPYQHWVYLA